MEIVLAVFTVATLSLTLRLIARGSKRSKRREESQTENLSPSLSMAGHVSAQVLWVIDGDTVDVGIAGRKVRVRLASIDCPEDGQPWGGTAKAGLIKMIGGRSVYLEEHGVDGYGRTIATLFAMHGQEPRWINVNERMVTLGHAWVMRRYYGHLSEDRKRQLNRLEAWARSRKVGLWRTNNPIPPWQWRREQ